jgi:hypothetical protein
MKIRPFESGTDILIWNSYWTLQIKLGSLNIPIKHLKVDSFTIHRLRQTPGTLLRTTGSPSSERIQSQWERALTCSEEPPQPSTTWPNIPTTDPSLFNTSPDSSNSSWAKFWNKKWLLSWPKYYSPVRHPRAQAPAVGTTTQRHTTTMTFSTRRPWVGVGRSWPIRILHHLLYPQSLAPSPPQDRLLTSQVICSEELGECVWVCDWTQELELEKLFL